MPCDGERGKREEGLGPRAQGDSNNLPTHVDRLLEENWVGTGKAGAV